MGIPQRNESRHKSHLSWTPVGVADRERIFMSRHHVLAATLVTSAMWAVSAQAAVTVTIDKSIQQMTVEVDGRPLYQWPVSTGKSGGYDTPSAKYKAFRMEKDHFSKESYD